MQDSSVREARRSAVPAYPIVTSLANINMNIFKLAISPASEMNYDQLI